MTEGLSTFCATVDCIDEDSAHEVRRHLLDWIGLVAGGRVYADSSSRVIAGVAEITLRDIPDGVPTGRALSIDRAALLAGTFAHSLDYDDTHLASSLHPGAPVIAAVLPVARRENADAEDMLTAISIGYDVTCALGRAIDPDAHYARGFHLTATCGSFGAAAAVGSILNFDAETFDHAFGIVGSQAAGSLQFLENGAWNKRLHPGLAASRGVLASTLANTDFRGAAEPITGEFGFLNSYSSRPHPELLAEIAAGSAVRETGIKPYPCCRYKHAAIDALLKLAPEIDPTGVESVTIDLPSPGVRLTGTPIDRKRRPSNFVDCQFSAPFATALVLLSGEAGLRAYLDAQDALDDPAWLELMDRVDVISTERTNEVFPNKWPAHVVVDDGHRHECFVEQPRGEPERPLDAQALEGKFLELLEGTALAPYGQDLVRTTMGLGKDTSTRDLLALLDQT